MIVELLIPGDGGTPQFVRVNASQVIVRNNVGTPIMAVAAEYGPERSQLVAHVGDDDFNDSLRKLGVHETTQLSIIEMPKPAPGARLVAGPKKER